MIISQYEMPICYPKGVDFMREWLVQRRGERTQESVSREAGISQNFYSSIENGIRRPSVETAKRIAAVLGFDWTEFFNDTDQPA